MRARILAVVAAAACLSACGTAAAAHHAGGTPAASYHTPSGVVSQSLAPPPSPTLGDLEQQWAAGPGGQIPSLMLPILQQYQAEIPAIQAGDYSGIEVTCLQMASQAQAGLNAPPNPDPVAQQYLSAAYSDYVKAGDECAQGAQTGDVAVLQQASADMSQAIAEGNAAVKQLQADCPNGAAQCAS